MSNIQRMVYGLGSRVYGLLCYRFILITSTWAWVGMIVGRPASTTSIWFMLIHTHSQLGCAR